MQSKAQQFIDLLVTQQLLAPEIVEELNRQVAESKGKLSPELIAKLLVDNGHLTKFQATKLVAEIRESSEEVGAGGGSPAGGDAELGFAPEDDDAPSEEQNAGVAAIILDDEPVDVVEAVEVVDAAEVIEAAEIVDVEEVDEEDAFDAIPRKPMHPVKPVAPKANPWDSFRIFGVGLLLALVVVAGVVLIRVFWVGSAEDRLAKAEEAYEQRSYETAALLYEDFVVDFPTHEEQSFAKVRGVLARIRESSEKAPDPVVGLKTSLELLPTISGESALSDDQQGNDLAGALIGLAGKFTERADDTPSPADRKVLMDEMDKLLELINNPQFVGNSQREGQAPTLMRIFEDRKRILREIGRDEELAESLVEIDQKLAAKDVMGAYAVRETLVDKYPLLRTNEALLTRIMQATAIQQTLVQPSSVSAPLVDQPVEPESGRRFVMANHSGRTVPSLSGKVLATRVKGSVYGIDGETGAVLWRQFVGRGLESFPVELSEQPGSDVVVSDPEQGVVIRLKAKSGEFVWSVSIGAPIHEPVHESGELFVATHDGAVLCLDAEGGQTKWSTQLPQSVPVGPAVAFGRDFIYVPGEHSNLYVISRSDGVCRQVHYLDHAAGAIAVPPLLFLGQLFIADNINSETSNIRCLDINEAGLIVGESQAHIPIGGNIIVKPIVSGRRLFAQSDKSAIVVLDVEATDNGNVVSVIASVPSNAASPTRSWAVAERTKLWIADKRFSQFDLQVTQQRLDRISTTNAGDVFTGPIKKYDDVIVHSRRLRGNRGVRVSAINADSGQEFWSTDLGVPVAFVTQNKSKTYDIINTAGMYFSFTGSKTYDKADANPGGGKASMLFADPVRLAGGKTILLNQSRPSQILVYSQEDSSVELLSTNIGDATVSSPAVAVGDFIGLGLDKGQFILVDPTTGRRVGAPYQPALEPGATVKWNRGVFLPESKTLIVANDRLKVVRLAADRDLRLLNEADLQSPLVSGFCKLGAKVCSVASTGAGDSLLAFDANSLAPSGSLMLPGRFVAGPFPVGSGVVVQTASQLMLVAEDGSAVWTADFPESELVAAPLVAGGMLVTANSLGQLIVVDASTGTIVQTEDTRQPFSSEPVARSGGVLVGSDEGVLMAVPLSPTQRGGQ